MRPRLWLASYPKSGNTWFRILIANLLVSDEIKVDINHIPDSGGDAGWREWFDRVTLIESGLLTHDEVDCLRPRVYQTMEPVHDTMGGVGDEPQFAKVHDAWTETPDGEPLLGGRLAASGAILLVRDPRDVAVSLAHHWNCSIDKAISWMETPNASLSGQLHERGLQLRQKFLTWSDHAASWLDQNVLPVHVVHYEELRENTLETFLSALSFAGRRATRAQATRAVQLSDFATLKLQEETYGFREQSPTGKSPFFRSGRAGAWAETLSAAQVARIESVHGEMMRRLGYRVA